jgi:hypothetical protein
MPRVSFLPLLSVCLLAAMGTSAFAESSPEAIGSQAPGGEKNDKKQERPTPDKMPELSDVDLKLRAETKDPSGRTIPGEELVYDVRVDGLPAGKAWLKVKKQDDLNASGGPAVWITTLSIKSSRMISWTYEVDDKATSKIDVKGGFSRFCHIERKDGEVLGQEISTFDYTFGNFKAAYQRTRPSDNVMKTYSPIPLSGKVLDPLSAIYYLRSFDWKAARKAIDLPIFTDRKVWAAHVAVGEKDTRDFGSLKNRTYVKLKADVGFKGLFERKGPMFVYLDLETGIPLRMEVEIPIGSAEVELSEHSHSPLDTPDKE